MGIFYALGAAFFAGITTLFAKLSVSHINTTFATLIRTVVILIFLIIIASIFNDFNEIKEIDKESLIFLIFSGIITALLWLSYFKALQLGTINQVTPIDKTSIILTLILSVIFLGESITLIKIISIILIGLGTYLMVKKGYHENTNKKYIIYAILTAIFTSLITILGKLGMNNVNSNIATMIRTVVALIVILLIVIIKKLYIEIKIMTKREWIAIILSGITTGLSWLCYFKALQINDASIIFSIEKLSIVVSVIGSVIFLKERLTKKALFGLITIILGTLILVF